MTDFYTYLHCKPNGDPFYVGKGSGGRSHDLGRRNKQHRAIAKKHGISIFVFPCDSEKQAFADEVQQIAQFKREGFVLANWTDGGEGASGAVRSAATKALMSANLVGNTRWVGRKHSDATKVKQSKASSGKPRSAEHAENLSKAIKAAMNRPEVKARASLAAKAQAARLTPEARSARASVASKAHWNRIPKEHRTVSEEVRAKISASKTGSIPWNKGLKSAPKSVTAPDQKKMVTARTENRATLT